MSVNKSKNKNGNNWLPPIEAFESTEHQFIEGLHPAMLDDESFLNEVSLDFGRTSGPGGQHRNRKATACTATHRSTNISGTASERRRQSENRKMSISRLRRTLAIRLRRRIDPDSFELSPLWESRREKEQMPINPKHRDYPHILAESLDVLQASDFNHAAASSVLKISPTQLTKVICHDKAALAWVNKQRSERSLHSLKG